MGSFRPVAGNRRLQKVFLPRGCPQARVSGFTHRFQWLSPAEGHVIYALLTRLPLTVLLQSVRLACVRQAASAVPPATEMFQFAGFASCAYEFSAGYPLPGGLPHSDIPGSPIARISPGLFAACHVLHRLSVPRHPPDALTCA